ERERRREQEDEQDLSHSDRALPHRSYARFRWSQQSPFPRLPPAAESCMVVCAWPRRRTFWSSATCISARSCCRELRRIGGRPSSSARRRSASSCATSACARRGADRGGS